MDAKTYNSLCNILDALSGREINKTRCLPLSSVLGSLSQFVDTKESQRISAILNCAPIYEISVNRGVFDNIKINYIDSNSVKKILKEFADGVANGNEHYLILLKKAYAYTEQCSCSKEAKELHDEIGKVFNP